MARNVADLALFLDTMAGFCSLDPLTFDAPAVSFSDGLARPVAPKRVAFTADYNGRMPIDREVREVCTKAGRRFEELGCSVEEASPDIGTADEAFHILRSQHFVVDRDCNSGATATNSNPTLSGIRNAVLPRPRPTSRVPNANAPRSTVAWSHSSAPMICW
jgi:Asp-tRNA(Asn)/Glu-tRNA(Gln) amidotransferase A subunit family amidase